MRIAPDVSSHSFGAFPSGGLKPSCLAGLRSPAFFESWLAVNPELRNDINVLRSSINYVMRHAYVAAKLKCPDLAK